MKILVSKLVYVTVWEALLVFLCGVITKLAYRVSIHSHVGVRQNSASNHGRRKQHALAVFICLSNEIMLYQYMYMYNTSLWSSSNRNRLCSIYFIQFVRRKVLLFRIENPQEDTHINKLILPSLPRHQRVASDHGCWVQLEYRGNIMSVQHWDECIDRGARSTPKFVAHDVRRRVTVNLSHEQKTN